MRTTPNGDIYVDPAMKIHAKDCPICKAGGSRTLPRRKEFVVQDLQEENRQLRLRIDLLVEERNVLLERVKQLEDDRDNERA